MSWTVIASQLVQHNVAYKVAERACHMELTLNGAIRRSGVILYILSLDTVGRVVPDNHFKQGHFPAQRILYPLISCWTCLGYPVGQFSVRDRQKYGQLA